MKQYTSGEFIEKVAGISPEKCAVILLDFVRWLKRNTYWSLLDARKFVHEL